MCVHVCVCVCVHRRHGFGSSPESIDEFVRQFQQDVFSPFVGGVLQGGLHAMFEEMQRVMSQMEQSGVCVCVCACPQPYDACTHNLFFRLCKSVCLSGCVSVDI